ncbi:hypothetical protein PV-S19_0173 [Pacmanvirus S19]|nr:hypothetical protein PV-S19_0173 [Pacmanvirus S19]
MESNFTQNTDSIVSTDLISVLTRQLENAMAFAENHKLNNLQSLFDALPDEILSLILRNLVTYADFDQALSICLVCRRFNQIIVDIIYSLRFELSHAENIRYFKELEKVDHWMEKILSFEFFKTYRDLMINVVKLMADNNCLYKSNNCIAFWVGLGNKDESHTYFISNEIYYHKITQRYIKSSDYSLESAVEYIDYNLRSYRIISHKDVQIYSSEHSQLVITDSSSILTQGYNIITAAKDYFSRKIFDELQFWLPEYTIPEQTMFNHIHSPTHSPLPMTILNHFATHPVIDSEPNDYDY